jgi:hypothetical protein
MDKNETTDSSINIVTNNEEKIVIAYSQPTEQIQMENIIEYMPVHALIRPVSFVGKTETLKPKKGKWNY